ncbi:signal peptidase I [Lentisphaerota bacterium WC36G]|nr:signal peptidase I [Lentisphaerae bacterium WC36]
MKFSAKELLSVLLKPSPKMQFIRIVLLIVILFPWFKYVCIPQVISGKSMAPTYPAFGFNFCWTPAVWNNKIPKRQSVVIMKYRGKEQMLLKRIIAFGGETVFFYHGKLFVNDKMLNEPYVKYPCKWDSKPITLKKDEVYVIGDNRSMSFNQHIGGVMKKSKIAGVPLW